MTAEEFAPAPPVCIVSPHLDDAVLSCGHYLAGAAAGRVAGAAPPTVLTVLAGAPEGVYEGYNVRSTGEPDGRAAVSRRRDEDAAALAALGARPHWLDLWDGDFRDGAAEEEPVIVAALRAALAELAPASVVFPLGHFHTDHLAVANACASLAAAGGAGAGAWYVYADRPYTLGYPGVAARLAELRAVLTIEELAPVPPAGDAKLEAFKLYASQYVPVSDELPGYAETMSGPERYWRVVPPA